VNRRYRLLRAALVLALLVLAAIVTGVASSAATTVIPKQLSGRWGREHQTVLMVVSSGGKVEINDTYHTTFSRVTAHRLTISYVPSLTVSDVPSCNRTGTYRWKFTNHQHSSDKLTLTKIHDACKARVHLFAGMWVTAYRMP
jgi:hypothetical protein